jgi:hypothetical protein
VTPISLYDIAIPSFQRALGVLTTLLDRAEAHFGVLGRDASELCVLRLAPDMNPFPFQVEAAINNAVGAAARLRGAPPSPVEGLATLEEIRCALGRAIAELQGLEAADFDGAETREIVLPSPKGARHFTGSDYLFKLALPNVHFHTAMAYALLRAEGLDIGKRDFLADLPPRRPPA